MPDSRNPELTIEQRIICAYAHHVRGIEVQDIAMIMSTNLGRVSEACTAVRLAAIDPVRMRRLMEPKEESEE